MVDNSDKDDVIEGTQVEVTTVCENTSGGLEIYDDMFDAPIMLESVQTQGQHYRSDFKQPFYEATNKSKYFTFTQAEVNDLLSPDFHLGKD